MKVILVTLSGDAKLAHDVLASRYPGAGIIDAPRALLEYGAMPERLRAARRLRPDIFAVMTEGLKWQFGQDALLLFGSLAGARESLVLDARGGVRSAARLAALLRSPFRIATQFIRGRRGVWRARRTLDRLEARLANDGGHLRATGPKRAQGLSAVYLRATPGVGTQPGGATSHINGVVNGLLAYGARISFISNDRIAGLDITRVQFQEISPEMNVMPRSASDIVNGMDFSASAADLTASAPPDFIYQRYARFSWAGVEASLRAGVPLFLEYNGSEVWIGKNWDRTQQLGLLEQCEQLNLSAASRIFVISEVEKRNLLRSGVPGDKIVVNPNGVDTDIFRPGIGGSGVRAEMGIEPNTVLVGFLGTFGPWHGVLTLAEAIASIPENADIRFLLIGEGSLRADVENILRNSGTLDRVIFAGSVSHGGVPRLLDACDILVSPHVPLADGSEFFGSPTKLFEYMAMGKGIVASRLGQIGEVLTDGETALLVESGNARDLADGLRKLAIDPETRNRLGESARAIAISRHTWLQNAERVLETYKKGGF